MVSLLKMFSTLLPWILIFLALGLALMRRARKSSPGEKCGWYLCAAAFCMLFLASTKPVSNLLAYSLERGYRIPDKETLGHLDAVVILAGGLRPGDPSGGRPEPTEATYSRLINGVRIFKENSAPLLVLQGTSRAYLESDAVVMADLAEQLGVARSKIIIETASRNTLEHAVELRKLLPAGHAMRLGIVTSAMHMPRSLMVFGWSFPGCVLVPIAVDYRHLALRWTLDDLFPSWDSCGISQNALHEIIGMAWYVLKHGRAT